MLLNEIMGSIRGPGFSGLGRGDFTQKYYVFIASKLHGIDDEAVREFLTNWFVDVFAKDSDKFKKDLFRRAVEKGISYRETPVFQQRHFYYLANFVCQIVDTHIKEFLTHWLSDIIGSTNELFLPERWKKFCGVELTPEEEKKVNRPRSRTKHRFNDE